MKKSLIKKISVISFVLIGFIVSPVLASSQKLIDQKSFNVNKGEKLVMKISGGDIKVAGWDKNVVDIKVFGNNKAAKRLKMKFEKMDYGVYIEAKRKGKSWLNWFSNISYWIEVMLPNEFLTELTTSGGDIKFKDVTGQASMNTSGGDIVALNFKGEANLKTSGGDVKIKNHSGNVIAGTSGGDIIISKNSGSVNAKTSGGDIKISVGEGSVSAKTSGGDIELILNGENEGVELATSGGDIEISVVANIKADVDLKTTGGDVDVDFGNEDIEYFKRGKYLAKFNGGGNKIYAGTSGGDIELRTK